mmetsp:Transcript_20888/g.45768  ORF Transcript_20888/g.45768 Transcript_20888/m.45768 type:complete len:132 (-) Transcript_20888:1829-2224(-)
MASLPKLLHTAFFSSGLSTSLQASAPRVLCSGASHPLSQLLPRQLHSTPSVYASPKEELVTKKLKAAFETENVEVQDTSGGCGSMYNIFVESDKFKGLRLPKQHQLVTAAIEDDIKEWHGFTLKTKIPDGK